MTTATGLAAAAAVWLALAIRPRLPGRWARRRPAPGESQPPPAGGPAPPTGAPLVPGPRRLVMITEHYACPCLVFRRPDRRIIERYFCPTHADFARWEKELQR
jgi:hypothetical protein